MSNQIYRIYTKWVAYKLRKCGFKIIGTDVNENFPQYDVYLFEDTPAFRNTLSKIKREKENV